MSYGKGLRSAIIGFSAKVYQTMGSIGEMKGLATLLQVELIGNAAATEGVQNFESRRALPQPPANERARR